MILFYTTDIAGEQAFFPPEESRHMGQVLRKRDGEEIQFVDGRGGRYRAEIESIDRRGCQARILERTEFPPRPFRFHLAIAPTKQAARMEWLLEKLTEIGLEEISLLKCDRSERQKVRVDRWERILQSAMKQSLQARLPVLNDFRPFEEVVSEVSSPQRFLAWCEEEEKSGLWGNLNRGADVTVLVGPEGDFTAREVELARRHGFLPVSLGANRLRTETAGLLACMAVKLANEKVV